MGDAWPNVIVAVGTALLAIATGVLAWYTKQAVAAASHQADMAAKALAASIQPTLVSVPSTGIQVAEVVQLGGPPLHQVVVNDPSDTSRHFNVPFRNIGPGVAFITGLSIHATPDVGWSGSLSNAIVAVGETTRAMFDVPTARPELDKLVKGSSFSVWVIYTDVSGEQVFRSRADLHRTDGRWIVRQVFLFRGGDETTNHFAASGPADW